MTYPGLTARSRLTALRIHFRVRVGDPGLGVSDSILGLLSCFLTRHTHICSPMHAICTMHTHHAHVHHTPRAHTTHACTTRSCPHHTHMHHTPRVHTYTRTHAHTLCTHAHTTRTHHVHLHHAHTHAPGTSLPSSPLLSWMRLLAPLLLGPFVTCPVFLCRLPAWGLVLGSSPLLAILASLGVKVNVSSSLPPPGLRAHALTPPSTHSPRRAKAQSGPEGTTVHSFRGAMDREHSEILAPGPSPSAPRRGCCEPSPLCAQGGACLCAAASPDAGSCRQGTDHHIHPAARACSGGSVQNVGCSGAAAPGLRGPGSTRGPVAVPRLCACVSLVCEMERP
ncbi:uncharacterized protein LOC116628839 [Phoca vitulina]|uniref:uncharacterized protein LOC116628839 n=1 Tax=Phoca vitulina TaxID=9720 RepID=UPI0013962214|nr:uncharacterized protein LOC116628839 [Phoca vitulina]